MSSAATTTSAAAPAAAAPSFPKFLRPGKVVVMLNGRRAGRKAVIVTPFEAAGKCYWSALRLLVHLGGSSFHPLLRRVL